MSSGFNLVFDSSVNEDCQMDGNPQACTHTHFGAQELKVKKVPSIPYLKSHTPTHIQHSLLLPCGYS